MKRLTILLLLITGVKICLAQNELKAYLNFETDKYSLTQRHQSVLDSLVSSLPAGSVENITVTGHTDWVGSDSYNRVLSQKRAEAAYVYLINKWGLSATQSFFGEEKPLTDNIQPGGRSINRRVEVTVQLKPVIKERVTVTEEKVNSAIKDTLYTSPGGAQVYVCGDCLPDGLTVDDIDINVTEALTPAQMRATGTVTRDAKDNCLISGGMVYVAIINKKTGVPVEELQCDTGLIVRIPAPAPDPSMSFYLSEDGGKNWITTDKGNMKIENRNGINYYSFSGISKLGNSLRGIGFNPDHPALLPLVPVAFIFQGVDLLAEKMMKNWQPGYIKTKGLKSKKAYVSGDSSVLDADYVIRKIINASDCGCIPQNQQVVSVYGSKMVNGKVKYYVYHNYRSNLKERRFFGLFGRSREVIRRKDWIVVNSIREVNEILAKAPGSVKPK